MGIQKKIKFFGKALFYVVFVAVLLLVIGMAISKFTNRVFFVRDRAVIWVMTDSMEDEIPAMSYIQIRKAEASEVKVGDVITFYSDDPVLQGHLNTHRVVEIVDGGKSFVTKGDNNKSKDAYSARADAVVGVYEKNLTGLSTVRRAFQTKIGLACTLLVIAVLLVYSFFSAPLKQLFKKEPKDSSADEQK